MGQLYYNYRDILKAPRLALMGKNIFLMMFHLILGYLGYVILTYVAIMVEGEDIAKAWEYYQLYPIGFLPFVVFWARLIWYAGMAFLLFMFLRGSLGVARCTFEELRGNFFFSIWEALKFIRKNIWTLYRAILGVIAFVAFLVLLGIVVGLIAKIPSIGEIFYGIFYDFPFFVVSLFAALVIFLLCTLLLTGPAVVAVKGEDAMTTLFDGFSALTSQPLRWIFYLGGSVVLAKVATFVLVYFSFRAIQFTNWTTRIVMGDKQADLFTRGAVNFFEKFPYTDFLTRLPFGITINPDHFFDFYSVGDVSWSMQVGSIFIMLSLVFIMFFIISYFMNTLVCAQVIAFLDIRNATHQEKLAFLPEEELEQDLHLAKSHEQAGQDKRSAGEKKE